MTREAIAALSVVKAPVGREDVPIFVRAAGYAELWLRLRGSTSRSKP